MGCNLHLGIVVCGLLQSFAAVSYAQGPLDDELRALDRLRKGLETPLDVVDERGAALLKKYERPEEQAQIYFQLAFVHAQSGVREPKQIQKYATAALDSKLLTPAQRATMYSYLCSAHEVDKDEKDFAARRRKAVAPLLTGLAELAVFKLPAVAPELPAVGIGRVDSPDPAEAARLRAAAEGAVLARREAERVRELVFRQKVLMDQVMFLYYREPVADEELATLATMVVGKVLADELVATAKAERERIDKGRKARQAEEAKRGEP